MQPETFWLGQERHRPIPEGGVQGEYRAPEKKFCGPREKRRRVSTD